jgi:hypothetical protein
MKRYDRHQQDVGNILMLEHVNVRVPDQRLATAFYIQGLGFTRDPYIMVGVENMWVNMGQTQFHLPTGEPNLMRGHVEIVVPDLEALTMRLGAVKDLLAGTKFACSMEDKYLAVTTPWGNRLRLHAAGPSFGDWTLGISAVEFPVATGNAAGIARFYEKVMGAPSEWLRTSASASARSWCSGRRRGPFPRTTAITSPSTSRTSPGPTSGSTSTGSSARRVRTTSTASRRSWTSTRARCCA